MSEAHTVLLDTTPESILDARGIEVHVRYGGAIYRSLDRWAAMVAERGERPLTQHPAWLAILAEGLGHTPYCLEAVTAERTFGFLPLSFVNTWLFGRYLVSLPYLNYGGVIADDEIVAAALVSRAIELADGLDVRHLELRHERPLTHPAFNDARIDKVHMRLPLPETPGTLWDQLSAKVRNQVRKGQKSELSAHWGGESLLGEFYDVFSQNMRDLGTPVYSPRLFRAALRQFPDQAELCVVRAGNRPAAAALLLHGWGVTEVPSASALREFNPVCANMLMYWHLLERAVLRGHRSFDFGRSSRDSGTYRFKAQWGAEPYCSEWQYYVRRGSASDLRPDHPSFQRRIRTWQRLPVWLTRLIGPHIVRGIP